MLVLTRRADAGDQSVILIGDEIEVTVIEVRGDQVRLGIAAPRGVAVHRKEIWLQIQAENRAEEGNRTEEGVQRFNFRDLILGERHAAL